MPTTGGSAFQYPTPELRELFQKKLYAALEAMNLAKLQELYAESEELLAESFRRHMGTDVAHDIREMIRVAERTLGLFIIRGQDTGKVETHRESQSRALTAYRNAQRTNTPPEGQIRVADVHPYGRVIRRLALVSDEVFWEAMRTARAENSLAREVVLRHIQRIEDANNHRAPELAGRPEININRVLEQVIGASGVSPTMESEMDWNQVDPSRLNEFRDGLRSAALSLVRLQQRVERRIRRRDGNTGTR